MSVKQAGRERAVLMADILTFAGIPSEDVGRRASAWINVSASLDALLASLGVPTCSECEGRGWVSVRGGGAGEPEWDGERDCDECGGTGRAPARGEG